jgi:pimeloyl-ACP methyl ester carboxylesterase
VAAHQVRPAHHARVEARYDAELRLRGPEFTPAMRAEVGRLLALDDEVTRTGAGWEQLRARVDSVRAAPWFAALEYEPLPPDHPARLRFRPWLDFDPVPRLRRLAVPALWVYAAEDETVPAVESAAIAGRMRAEGLPYTVVTLAGASHAMLLPPAQGERWPSLHPDYARVMTDWLRDQLARR